MSESGMRQRLVKALQSLDAISIEAKGRAGVPDINYVGGWIECKYLRRWPRSAETQPVKFGHPFMTSQARRAEKRVTAGGTSLLCAQVDQDWFFFDGADMRHKFGKMTKIEMIETSIYYSHGLNKKDLLQWIKFVSNG